MKKSVSKKVSKKSVEKSTLDMSELHTNDDVKGYIGFVCERFENQVSAVAEQFLGLNQKVDDLTERVDLIIQKVDRHSVVLDAHTEMIGKLMINGEEVKTGLSQKVEREEFNKLEMRLVTLESIVYSGREGKSTDKRK